MKKVLIYTMNSCPYCERAKMLLSSQKIDFEEKKLDPGDLEAWKKLEKKTAMKTMPQIFIGDRCVGGYTELASLDEKGELKKLILEN